MTNLMIDCNNYKLQKPNTIINKNDTTIYRNSRNIYIPKIPLENKDIGKSFYQKPYKFKTKKRILPFIIIRQEHDYMWFSRY